MFIFRCLFLSLFVAHNKNYLVTSNCVTLSFQSDFKRAVSRNLSNFKEEELLPVQENSRIDKLED